MFGTSSYAKFPEIGINAILFVRKNMVKRQSQTKASPDSAVDWDVEKTVTIALPHITTILMSYEIVIFYFFQLLFGCPQPILDHYRGDSLTHPMLITAFWYFDPKVTGSLFIQSFISNHRKVLRTLVCKHN